MAVHWKPSSVAVPQADFRDMQKWYETTRYGQIISEKMRSIRRKSDLLRTTNANTPLRSAEAVH